MYRPVEDKERIFPDVLHGQQRLSRSVLLLQWLFLFGRVTLYTGAVYVGGNPGEKQSALPGKRVAGETGNV